MNVNISPSPGVTADAGFKNISSIRKTETRENIVTRNQMTVKSFAAWAKRDVTF